MSACEGIRVGVVGFGTIGKRVAAAVSQQQDMTLVGVAIRSFRAGTVAARQLRIPLFASAPDRLDSLLEEGAPVLGDLDELLGRVDAMVDCVPRGEAAARVGRYEDAGVRGVFQGGEHHNEIGFTFSTFANYEAAVGQTVARIASCNTTGLVRVLVALGARLGINRVHVTLVRSATDTNKPDKGCVGGLTPVLGLSHHGPDLEQLLPYLSVYSQAISAPTQHGHLVTLAIELTAPTNAAEAREALRAAPRVLLIEGPNATSTGSIVAASVGCGVRDDRPEVMVWADSVVARDGLLFVQMLIHMESVVIPETIDCIRALCGTELDRDDCTRMTDRALGLQRAEEPWEGSAA